MNNRIYRLISMACVIVVLASISFSANATLSTITVAAGSTGTSSEKPYITGTNKSTFNVSMNYFCFDGYSTNVAPSGSPTIKVTPYRYVTSSGSAALQQASATLGFSCGASPSSWYDEAYLYSGFGLVGDRMVIRSSSTYKSKGYVAQFNWYFS